MTTILEMMLGSIFIVGVLGNWAMKLRRDFLFNKEESRRIRWEAGLRRYPRWFMDGRRTAAPTRTTK